MHYACPQCGSKAFKRNGYTRHGKQNHRCLDCGRQFSLETFHFTAQETCVEIVDGMLSNNLALENSLN